MAAKPARLSLVLSPLLSSLLLLLAQPGHATGSGIEAGPRLPGLSWFVEALTTRWSEASFSGSLQLLTTLTLSRSGKPKLVTFAVEHRAGRKLLRLTHTSPEGDSPPPYWLVSDRQGVMVVPSSRTFVVHAERPFIAQLEHAAERISKLSSPVISSLTYQGRSAVKLEAPQLTLIVDRKTSVPLKLRLTDRQGNTLEYLSFSSLVAVRDDELPKTRFMIPADYQMVDMRTRHLAQHRPAPKAGPAREQDTDFLPLVPVNFPQGWQLRDVSQGRVPTDQGETPFYQFQLANPDKDEFLSIFQFPSGTLGTEVMEELRRYSRGMNLLVRKHLDHDLLLMGDPTPDELVRFVELLIYDPDLASLVLSLLEE